jgi:MerR family redox-sensitive transcriptional activator SoxR
MTIGELSHATGVPAPTIRYWERIGAIPKPQRTSGQRRYSPESVDQIAVIQLAQASGFRLEEIRQLLRGFGPEVAASERWRTLALRKRVELDEQMARLRTMRQFVDRVIECKCLDLSECGRKAAKVIPRAPSRET